MAYIDDEYTSRGNGYSGDNIGQIFKPWRKHKDYSHRHARNQFLRNLEGYFHMFYGVHVTNMGFCTH